MNRRLGRRPLFFLFLAALALVMVPASPGEFRSVCWFTAGLALFWAILLGIEDLVGPRSGRNEPPSHAVVTPFDPPPPPGEGRQS